MAKILNRSTAVVVLWENINMNHGQAGWQVAYQSTQNSLGAPYYHQASSIAVYPGDTGGAIGDRIYFWTDPDFGGPVLALKQGYQIVDLTKCQKVKSVFACVDWGDWNDNVGCLKYGHHRFEGCCTWAPGLSLTELPPEVQEEYHRLTPEDRAKADCRLGSGVRPEFLRSISESERQQLYQDIESGHIPLVG